MTARLFSAKGQLLPQIIRPDFSANNAGVKPVTRAWWLSVLAWIDFTDITTHKRSGYVFFMDLLIKRPTEFAVFLLLFVNAYERSIGRLEMTSAQVEAVVLANEAAANGINPARYVASKKGTSLRAAYYLLKRADGNLGKIFNFPQKTHSSSREKNYLPDEDTIKRRMAGFVIQCPTAPLHDDCAGTVHGDRDLCFACSKRYGVEGERPQWLQDIIRDNRRVLREDALADLLVYNVADDDEFDYLVEAA